MIWYIVLLIAQHLPWLLKYIPHKILVYTHEKYENKIKRRVRFDYATYIGLINIEDQICENKLLNKIKKLQSKSGKITSIK